ncbi:MAG: hypothetical protein L0Z62_25665 [Gemmataceae bacterium]|nr:hypothetical protein [Gemmataceae bacterium]
MTKELRRLFPGLRRGEYRITSDKTKRYNCIAWAAGVDDDWWEACEDGYWPDGVPEDGTITAARRLFESLGYTMCENADLEPGFEKVAIYGDVLGYTHAARQLPDGGWTSKLGSLQDIEHRTPEDVAGDEYGIVVHLMRRAIRTEKPAEKSEEADSK